MGMGFQMAEGSEQDLGASLQAPWPGVSWALTDLTEPWSLW